MKKLLALALVAIMAGGALAQEMNEAGFWYVAGDGDYRLEHAPAQFMPFDMVVTLHNPTVATVGGYEVGLVNFPAELLVQTFFIYGGLNFGTATNQIVGYPAPIPAEELTILARLTCLALSPIGGPIQVEFTNASSQSIPGHEGMVYANGANPDDLIACGFITGSPWVFTFAGDGPVAVETQTLSGVKALFE